MSILQILMIVLGSRVLDMANVWMEWIHTRAPVKKVILVTTAKQVSFTTVQCQGNVC